MSVYKKILVAVDGSQTSFHALEEALKFAQSEGSEIIAVSVIPPYSEDFDLMTVGDIVATLRKKHEDILREAREIANKQGVSIRTILEEGEPYESIIDLAQEEDCDLIVMGRRGLSRLERVFIGSVTVRVIGYSPIDVLVITRDSRVGFNKILIATDGSKFSERAYKKAVAFASSYGSQILALSAVNIPPELHKKSPKTVEELTKKAQANVEAVKKEAEPLGLSVETVVREGEPFKVIVDVAKEEGVSIIFTGSHGRTGLRRLLMGSVTEKVISHTPCPVLVVKS